MRFVSYAQNYEDVMLWRALQHVQGGFYIDVGANDPDKDSVTKAFYERGWQGINIEPVAAHHADLRRARPRDVNLRCAVGDREGSIELWECEVRGLATTDPEVAQQHEREGRGGAWQTVPVRTLAAVCEEHRATGEIHFVKIDVEGGEENVLRGADFRRFRPWIVVVEATRPNSSEQTHESWEHLLTGAEYRCAYADGLNRFYLAREHEQLAAAFAYPPNVFDDFERAQQRDAREWAESSTREARNLGARVKELETMLQALRKRQALLSEAAARAGDRMRQTEERLHEAEDDIANEAAARAARVAVEAAYQAEVAAAKRALAARETQVERARDMLERARDMLQLVYASRSWRMTRPLRWVTARLKGEPRIDPAASIEALQFPPEPPLSPAPMPHADAETTSSPEPAVPQLLQAAPARAWRVFEQIRAAAGDRR